MLRDLMAELKKWKSRPGRKPLMMKGARQVGKTWIMKEFGNSEYEETVYINFDNNEQTWRD